MFRVKCLIRATLCITISASCLAACTDLIRLKNAQTGQIAQCGPYDFLGGSVTAQREAECIHDFQRQGDERMP